MSLPPVRLRRRRCAIDIAGVADYTIEFDKSDTAKFAGGRRFLSEAVGDRAQARAISPLYQLDRFNVPVLIVHGKDDQRVPYENAKVLRAALNKARKTYVWLTRSEEEHGFYTEKDRADLYRQEQAFLAQYLGKP